VKKCIDQSKVLGEWSTMIGYEMDTSPVGVYVVVKTSPVDNFEHGRENDTVVSMVIYIFFF
jgi:hypothetical protein